MWCKTETLIVKQLIMASYHKHNSTTWVVHNTWGWGNCAKRLLEAIIGLELLKVWFSITLLGTWLIKSWLEFF